MKTPRFLPAYFGRGLLAHSSSPLLRAFSTKILALGVFCLGWAALAPASAQAAGVLGGWSDPGNAILSLAVMPDLTGDGRAEFAAGLNSGRVVCLSGAPASPASLLWEAQLNGSASVVMALPFTGEGAADGDVVAATDLGQAARIRGTGAQKGQVVWTFNGLAGFASLAMLPDRNDDGWPEVLAGGADQRVYLRDGATGNEIWTCSFVSSSGGYGYIHTIIPAGDINTDSIVDVAAYTWDGKVITIDGATGAVLWSVAATTGYTDPLAAIGDLSGDGIWDLLVGGNNGLLRLYSGAQGTLLWSASLGRPLRAVIVTEDVTGDGKPDAFGLTAEGIVSCVAGGGSGTSVKALWTASLGDTGRVLAAMSDADADDSIDIAASAEDGTVAAFSGANGAELWRWAGPDTARSLVNCGDLNGDGIKDLAAGCLDGSVTFLSGKPSDWTASSSKQSRAKSSSAKSSSAKSAAASSSFSAPIPFGAQPARPQEEFPISATIASEVPNVQSPLSSSLITAGASSVPLLLYHDVQPVMYYPYGVTADNFAAQMDIVVRGGYTPVTLPLIADWIAGRADLPDNPICITFDGPYEGQHTYGMKILQERGLSATVYCTSDWIGTANHCDWHQLREMESTGVVHIENHTLDHFDLSTLNQANVTLQIKGCTDSIKKHCNGKVATSHAYPYGGYNNTVMNYLKNLGITTATTVVQRHALKTDNPLAIPRYSVVPSTTLENFKTKIRYTEPAFTPTPTASPAPKVQGWLLR